ncbi:MAG: TIGR04282 family arsenosugar biosynthesis glycosyltransferase [Bermanella sp.]
MLDHIIIQFAKLPVLGKVKTRLSPDIGDQSCLELHRQLLQYTHDNLKLATDALGGISVLSIDQFGADSQIEEIAKTTPLLVQVGNDLGERMANAIRWGLTLANKVLIVGSDCPVLTVEYYQQALNELNHEAHVFINAEDGGYVLVGATQTCDELFKDVPWGTGDVMAATFERLGAANKKAAILGPLWDVDRIDDLHRLKQLKSNWPN